MLALRNMTMDDLNSADTIVRMAYGTTQSRRPSLLQNLRLQPDGWFLASLDDKPVGLVGAINYGPFAYAGTMSVLPAVQRRGIGRALLTELLEWLDQQQCPTVLLDATPTGALLYEHFAFRDAGAVAQWSCVNPISMADVRSIYRQNRHIESLQQKDFIALTSYDARYFGAGRAPVFSLLFMDLPDRVFVTRNTNGQIAGYLFAKDQALGPWVADSYEDAKALLIHALSTLSFSRGPMVLVPEENVLAARLLEHYGFKRQRVLRHMLRGAQARFRQRERIYGQASFALG